MHRNRPEQTLLAGYRQGTDKEQDSTPAKKLKIRPAPGKVTLSVFYDSQVV